MTRGRRATQAKAADTLALAAFLCASALVLALAGRPLATDDTWWHLKLGEVYAAHGPFVDADPLLHTAADQPTVPHEWLFQVLLHGVERVGGFFGLRALHAALVAGILAWVFVLFRRASDSLALAAAAGSVWLALSWYRLIQLRPELLSLLALLALGSGLLLQREAPRLPRVLAVLALLVLWANLHSLFAIGLALLLAAALGSTVEAHGLGAGPQPAAAARSRWLFATFVCGTLLSAANPQGFAQHLTFFTESATGDIWQLEDDFLRWTPWRPAEGNRALPMLGWLSAGLLLAGWLVLAARAAFGSLRQRSPAAPARADFTGMALAAAAWLAMLVAVRFHWLAFLPLLFVLRALPANRRSAWAAAVVALGVGLALPRAVDLPALRQELAEEPGGYWRTPYLAARYCGNAMQFLRDSGVQGRMFHPFNLGGFLGYWLAPGLRSFIDGRLDHAPTGVLDDYLAVRQAIRMSDEQRFMRILDARQVDVFVGTHFRGNRYEEGTWTDQLRRLVDWVPIFASQECSVYLRALPRNADDLARVAAYYAKLGIPFSEQRGPDLGAALVRQRAWADEHRITPPGFDALRARQRGGTEAERLAATDALARGLWRIGAFREQVPLDRVLVIDDPSALEPRRRLADGLLQLGLADEALPFAKGLLRRHPGYSDVPALHRLVAQRAGE